MMTDPTREKSPQEATKLIAVVDCFEQDQCPELRMVVFMWRKRLQRFDALPNVQVGRVAVVLFARRT